MPNWFNFPISKREEAQKAFREEIYFSYVKKHKRSSGSGIIKTTQLLGKEETRVGSFELNKALLQRIEEDGFTLRGCSLTQENLEDLAIQFGYGIDALPHPSICYASIVSVIAAREARFHFKEGKKIGCCARTLQENKVNLRIVNHLFERIDRMLTLPSEEISDAEAVERGEFALGYGTEHSVMDDIKLRCMMLAGIHLTRSTKEENIEAASKCLGFVKHFLEGLPMPFIHAIGDSIKRVPRANQDSLNAFDNLVTR